MSHGTFVARVQGAVAVGVVGAMLQAATAGVIWDGGGGADKSWGTPANWDSDTLPPFDGSDSLTVTAPSTGNTALQLGADRSIARITFGAGSTAMSLSGSTLRLNSTTSSAGAGTALWNASTSDGVAATINSNILLQSGTAGSYTGHFRENNNSSGGTKFSGTITQGSGENWTLRFSRASSRGVFSLANSGNSISTIRNDGADVYSDVAGAFGGAALTLSGGSTGTRLVDQYTTPVSNDITLVAASNWTSQVQTRLSGSLTQSNLTFSYGSSQVAARDSLTRIDYSSVSGTGNTALIGGAFAPSSMSKFASGSLDIGSSSGMAAVVVLSGSAGNDVPTWTDFSTARTYNQSGGSGSWRLTGGTASSNSGPFGGFAARGADLVIPNTVSNLAFARNFVLGSAATLDGVRYANHSVNVAADIAYGSVAGAHRYFQVAPNAGTSRTATALVLDGPVHELSGQITGDNVVMYPVGQANTALGMVRISNAANNLTGNSRWIIGGNRVAWTTQAGTAISAASNMADLSSAVLIFTSDGAFGGAVEVNVASQGSSGSNPAGVLLFEDTNNAGNTTFTRNINLQNNAQSGAAPTWGSYGGDVVYTGTATLGGSIAAANDSVIHVQAGTMTLGVTSGAAATVTNNRAAGTTHNKSGPGTLDIRNLTINGTQSVNNWSVRAGTLLVNQSLASGTVSVESTGTIGGSGTINGATTVKSGAFLAPGNSPGVLSVVGNLALNSGSEFQVEAVGASYDAVDVTGTVNIAGSKLNVLSLDDITSIDLLFIIRNDGNDAVTGTFTGGITMPVGVESYEISYTGDYATNSTTGGNDVVLHSIVIPEPTALGLIGAAGLVVLRRRRRV